MKNKESFLKELQNRLSVLEEAEQQDILAEYAQHIDLRAAGGLTEEEAIRDFGDIDQLAAEILGAYHVKPTYQASVEKKRLSIPSPWPALRRGGAGVAGFFRRLGGGIAGRFRRLWGAIRACGAKLKNKIDWDKDFFETARPPEAALSAAEGAAAPEPVAKAPRMEKGEELVSETRETAGAMLGRGFRRLCRGAAWLAWNLLLLLCALPFAGLGLAALVCLGALVVLLAQGYPLTGVTLCCLGGAACCVGVLGLGSGLIWHRAVPAAQAAGTAPRVDPVTGSICKAEAEREEVREDAE